MEKNKNILIGGLLAIVLVMAVGYAAFATQLTINGSATITSNWNVHFDTTYNNNVVPAAATGITATATNTPTGSISSITDSQATLTAHLYQPGDKVTFTLKILNDGNLDAKLKSGTPTLTLSGGTAGTENGNKTMTKGNIKFTVSSPAPATIAAQNSGDTDEATMTVVAEFVNNNISDYKASDAESATLTVAVEYEQA